MTIGVTIFFFFNILYRAPLRDTFIGTFRYFVRRRRSEREQARKKKKERKEKKKKEMQKQERNETKNMNYIDGYERDWV